MSVYAFTVEIEKLRCGVKGFDGRAAPLAPHRRRVSSQAN
jgi:hypothetical protein